MILIDAARAAHHAGLCVLPAKADGSKGPDVREWKSYIDGTLPRPDLATVEAWFLNGRQGLGYVCGAVSGHLLMLELEGRAVDEGMLGELRARADAAGLGDLLERIEVGYTERTPSGGIHWLLRCPDGVPANQRLARRQAGVDDHGRPIIEVLFETRGQGGWTVAAPSHGRTHPTGAPWELELGDVTTIATVTCQELIEILDLCRSFDAMPRPEAPTTHTRLGTPLHGGARPGDTYNARTTWAQVLEPHGWRHLFDRGHEAYWCRPGKPTGISATTNYADSDRLVVFSSSTPFDTERSYDRFGAHAVLEHHGDLAATAKALREQGHGDPRPPTSFERARNANREPRNANREPRNEDHGSNIDGGDPTTDEAPDDAGPEPYTDLGNARRLVAAHGQDLRYAPQLGRWLAWDGRRWAEDITGEAQRRAKNVVDHLPLEDTTDPKALAKHWAASQGASRISAIIELARTEPGVPVLLAQLDADPWALNLANGTLDLRSGQLRPHDRAGHHTKLAPVAWDPTARCPRWEAFLDRIFAGDQDVIGFVQRAVGYSLTASVREQVLFFLHGAGANGKSTFLGVIQQILGDYAIQSAPDLLTQGGDEHPTAVADLVGRRLVATIETEDGARLAEALVKQLTGGDTIRARRMRQDYFEYQPTHKLWFAANHKPNIRGNDHAIWRRIRLIPFTVTIPENERDGDLPAKLAAELPGILRWAIDGARAWLADGLGLPAAVDTATADWRQDEDHVGRFVADCLEERPEAHVSAKALRAAYEEWCNDAGDRPWSGKALGKVLTERGYARHHTRAGWWWLGIRIAEGDDTDAIPDGPQGSHSLPAQMQPVTHRDPSPSSTPHASAHTRVHAHGAVNGEQGSQRVTGHARFDDIW